MFRRDFLKAGAAGMGALVVPAWAMPVSAEVLVSKMDVGLKKKLADAALAAAKKAGATYCDVRIGRSLNQYVITREDKVQNIVNTRLAQKMSQVTGVGLVTLSGGQRPAVRIQADTNALASVGIGLDTLRSAITAANANSAKGSFDGPTRSYTINTNDQLLTLPDYQSLIVG